MKWLSAICVLMLTALPARAEITVQEITSPGGIKAWLVEEPSIPFVALELRFRGGTSVDPEGKRGAVNMMTALLEDGSGDMDTRTFTAAVEGIAASFGYDANDDAISISARYLSETQDEAIDLLRQSLIAPRFDADAIERVRGQILAGLRSDQTDPDEIVSRVFDALTYGDHPYATSGDGTLDTVQALTRDDLLAVHRGTLVRDRVYVSAAGDIDAETLGRVLDRLLGDLPATGGLPEPADIDVALPGGVVVEPFETPQSVALFGHAGLDRDDPDFIPAFVLNTIFGGGGFEARLMEEVREKRGLTYGVYSYLVPKDHAALFVGRVASANDRIAQTIDVIRDEWQKMDTAGVTEEELESAKKYLTGSYPLRFDGNASIARILVGMQMDNLTPDYIRTRNDKVNAITLDDINRVAARLMDPESLTFVVVGMPEGLEPMAGQ